MAAYVDSTGVTSLTADIKALADQTYVSDVAYDSTNNKITKTIGQWTVDVVSAATLASSIGNLFYYGTTSTGTTTSTKAVTLSNSTGYSLKTGTIISVLFTQNSGDFTSMSVNGGTSKNVYLKNSTAIPTGMIPGYAIGIFIYTGSYWTMVGVTPTIISTSDISTGTNATPGLVTASVLASSFVKGVSYNSIEKKIQQTIKSTTTDIVSVDTLKTDIGIATVSEAGLMSSTDKTKLDATLAFSFVREI